jgi:hypothetical protein
MQRSLLLACCAAIAFVALTAPSFARQGDESVLSPPAKASCAFSNGKSIKVGYSSPRRRGRKIFGDLVPYGEVWRAGADDATRFIIDTPVMVRQKSVPAGNYTIFTIPTPTKWTLIISKETGEWGIPYPGQKYDFARMDMQVSKLPSRVENFTISFDSAGDRCTMRLDWETTRASVDITQGK